MSVVSIGGAQAIGRVLDRYGPNGLDVRLAGLCDEGEEPHFRRALERAGFGADLTRADMERLGFFVCVADLEDELIRSLGTAAVEEVSASAIAPFWSVVSIACMIVLGSDNKCRATLSCMFPRRRRRLGIRKRIARFVRALFGGGSSSGNWDDDAEGGVGVREPRRPLAPSLTGAAALELPDDSDDAR